MTDYYFKFHNGPEKCICNHKPYLQEVTDIAKPPPKAFG